MTAKRSVGLHQVVLVSLLLVLGLSSMGPATAAGEYVVINLLDSGSGSLRWAIEQANNHPGPDVIRFYPNLTDNTILLASNLPPLTDSETTIDASPNWVGSWPGGEPGIGLTKREFDSTATVGLHLQGADNCVIKGLRITGLAIGVFISAGDDPSNRATGNTIGAGTPGGRMLIRNCGVLGILISEGDGNRVHGCYLGTSKAGNLPEPNGFAGVHIIDGGYNEIGGVGPLEGNLIGASTYGIWIEGSGAVSNTVQANQIGVGMLDGDIGNTEYGVFVGLGASYNRVGGAAPDAGNAILNNGYSGVFIGQEGGSILAAPPEFNSIPGINPAHSSQGDILSAWPTYNSVTGNYIADNTQDGVKIQLADNNTIQGNTIVGNGQSGVSVETGTGNRISSNFIGTDAWSEVSLGNQLYGVLLSYGAQDNRVEGNVIAQNNRSGVYIDDGTSNTVDANFIGTDASGTAGLGNGHHGVGLYNGANTNWVTANVIVQNNWSGVAIFNTRSTYYYNFVCGNYIGVTKNGQPLGNGYYGVAVVDSSHNAFQQNVIAHNGTSGSRAGVRIEGATATNNPLWWNSIHSNSGAGIELVSGGNENRAAPVISHVECHNVTGGGMPANGTVQLFSDDADEGRFYEGQVTVDSSGQWVYRGPFRGPYLTATVADPLNNSSPFSAPVPAGPCYAQVYLPVILR